MNTTTEVYSTEFLDDVLIKDPKILQLLLGDKGMIKRMFEDNYAMKLILNDKYGRSVIAENTVLIDTDKGKQLTHKSELPHDYGLELVNDLVKDQHLNHKVQLMSHEAYSMASLIKYHGHDTSKRYRLMMLKYVHKEGYSDTHKMLIEDMYDGREYLIWSNQAISSYLQHQCHDLVVGELALDKDKTSHKYIYSSSGSPSGRKELMMLRINTQTEELVPVSKGDHIYGNSYQPQSSVFISVEVIKAYRKQYKLNTIDYLDQGAYKITEMCQDKYRNGMKWYFLISGKDGKGLDFVFRSNYWFDQEMVKYAHNATITELYLTVTGDVKAIKGMKKTRVVIINNILIEI